MCNGKVDIFLFLSNSNKTHTGTKGTITTYKTETIISHTFSLVCEPMSSWRCSCAVRGTRFYETMTIANLIFGSIIMHSSHS